MENKPVNDKGKRIFSSWVVFNEKNGFDGYWEGNEY